MNLPLARVDEAAGEGLDAPVAGEGSHATPYGCYQHDGNTLIADPARKASRIELGELNVPIRWWRGLIEPLAQVFAATSALVREGCAESSGRTASVGFSLDALDARRVADQ